MRRYHLGQRSEEEEGQEEETGHHARGAGPAADLDARGALDVGGARRRADEPGAERRDRVDDETLLEAQRLSRLLVDETRGLRDTDERRDGIEEVGEEDPDDRRDE